MEWLKKNGKNGLILVLAAAVIALSGFTFTSQTSMAAKLSDATRSGYTEGREDAEALIQEARQDGYDEGYTTGKSEGLEEQDKAEEAAKAAAEASYQEGYEKGLAEGKASAEDVSSGSSASAGSSGTATTRAIPADTTTSSGAQTMTVYITDTGEKYHLNGCRYLSHSQHAISLSNAKSQGYDACSVCDPPA